MIDTEFRLQIIGSGPDREVFENIVKELGISERVQFLGSMTRKGVKEAMMSASFFVMPSHSETFSIVCIEAIACGLPVVATRCGGPNDIVTDKVGRLVPPRDVLKLTMALDEMAENCGKFPTKDLAADALDRFGSRIFAEGFLDLVKAAQIVKDRNTR